eukprot:7690457-Alexandrium_andersonii.AAC.1
MCNPSLLFCSYGGLSPDPWLDVLVRRARLFRVMWHSSEMHQSVRNVLVMHVEKETVGVCHELWQPEQLCPGFTGGVPWEAEFGAEADAWGPVGLMLSALARVGARVDAEMLVYAELMPVWSLVLEPWSVVRSFLVELHAREATMKVGRSRASLGVADPVDWRASAPEASLPAKDQSLLRALQAGGVWTDHERHKADMTGSPVCQFCGYENGDLEHLMWGCE